VKHFALITLGILFSLVTLAQGPDQTEEKITDLLSMGNYKGAIPLYQKLIKKYPDNYEFKYQLGKCLLKTKGDPKAIIDLMEGAIPHLKLDAEPLYYLGQAYQHDLQLDKAIDNYMKARVEANKTLAPILERQIETCLHAKELIKYPVNVTFNNLGSPVNSRLLPNHT
jgi:tetratricopeptide (TPR) repeat protein